MAREFYGPTVLASPTPDPTDDNVIQYVSATLFVYRARTGGAAETDLQTAAGVATTTVTPDPATGAIMFFGPDGYTGSLWIADPAGTRWEVAPAGLANRLATTTSLETIFDAKGDLLVGSGPDAVARLAASGVIAVLVADPSATLGVKWATGATLQLAVGSNLWVMPVWDGTGPHPVRPVGLPSASVVYWRQPTGPLVGSTYSKPGDLWMGT